MVDNWKSIVVKCLGLSLCMLFLGHKPLYAQDPIFSQYYNAPLQMNPGFAGQSEWGVVSMNYRNQWPAIPRAYQTYSLSADKYFDRANSGLGIFLLSDDAGDGILTTFMGSIIYSYNIKVNEGLNLRIGVEAGVIQNRLDWEKLIFSDQLIAGTLTPNLPTIPSEENRPRDLAKTSLDLSTGLLLYSKKYYAGFSLKHLNGPETSILAINEGLSGGVPIRFSAHAGTQFNFESDNKYVPKAFLSPNILFVRQSELTQINVGSLIGFRSFFTGLWYRHTFSNPDALIFSIGVRPERFRISYSFDLTISDLAVQNGGGSHEVGIVIDFGAGKTKNIDLNDCFSIFR